MQAHGRPSVGLRKTLAFTTLIGLVTLLTSQILGHLQVLFERRQGLLGKCLDVLILAVLRLMLEQGDVLLVVVDHIGGEGAIKLRAAYFRQFRRRLTMFLIELLRQRD